MVRSTSSGLCTNSPKLWKTVKKKSNQLECSKMKCDDWDILWMPWICDTVSVPMHIFQSNLLMLSPRTWCVHTWRFWNVRHLANHQRWSNHCVVPLAENAKFIITITFAAQQKEMTYIRQSVRSKDFRFQPWQIIDTNTILFSWYGDENVLSFQHFHLLESASRNQLIHLQCRNTRDE